MWPSPTPPPVAPAPKPDPKVIETFEAEMKKADYPLRYGKGQHGYDGPMVRVESRDIPAVSRASSQALHYMRAESVGGWMYPLNWRQAGA